MNYKLTDEQPPSEELVYVENSDHFQSGIVSNFLFKTSVSGYFGELLHSVCLFSFIYTV